MDLTLELLDVSVVSIHTFTFFSVSRMYSEERTESLIYRFQNEGLRASSTKLPASLLCPLQYLGAIASGPSILLLKHGKRGKEHKTQHSRQYFVPLPLAVLAHSEGNPLPISNAPL